ncbi:MAG: spore germination protein [Clostridium sp.]
MVFTNDYDKNINEISNILPLGKSFDILRRDVNLHGRKVTFLFVDGFVKDENLQLLIRSLFQFSKEDIHSLKTSLDVQQKIISAIEISDEEDINNALNLLLAGQTLMIMDGISKGIMLDLRTYPARGVEEPDQEKVLRGAKDGFVETIVFNTALIRRRIRDSKLIFEMTSIGKFSKTDVTICYLDDRVKKSSLEKVKKHLSSISVDALTMGTQTIIESIYKSQWYNPFPKVRYTERPDVASAHILEGKIAIIVDNTPSVMLLPTSIFDFLQDVDDFYTPVISGNYNRIIRNLILLATVLLTPFYLYMVKNPTDLPLWLGDLIGKTGYKVPLLVQFLLLEVSIDALKLASLNTPGSLGMSLSVVGALILGEFAVSTGWFIPEAVLYMAIVALGTFCQPSIELSYSLKFIRIFLLILTNFFGIWGLLIGIVLSIILMASTKTITGEPYLYPLYPFNWSDLRGLLFRTTVHSKKNSNNK